MSAEVIFPLIVFRNLEAPDTIKSPNDVQYIKRKRCQNIEAKDFTSVNSSSYQIKWESYIFPNITDENEESITETILFDIFGIPNEDMGNKEKPISKNNIIIKSGSDNIESLLLYADELSRVYLPQIAIITNNQVRDIKDNRYLTLIKQAADEKLYKTIFNYLWERDCYFNQRGLLINEYSPYLH